ncbi:hypothetical protein PsorP6_010757 [Peronosclerospora sorghi]|uniref:Uncharacterized protein n=1 Tax=Peronosclerospora sorghi TaxID=230839 RepID=A0ACC0VYM2_9STRA|nr:hypothetical protein PsorP6_010757 [Peronosclerospora sorghi]
MKDFESSHTFNGIEVIEATQDNFKRIVCNERVSILFGHVIRSNGLLIPLICPKLKAKMYEIGFLDNSLTATMHLSREDSSWIIWPPHAMFPVYRVDVNDTNRSKILQCLPEGTQGQQQPLNIRFTNPHRAETGKN